MRILLIVPPITIDKSERSIVLPPLGLASIAAVLEKEHEVKIIDAVIENFERRVSFDEQSDYRGISWSELREKIKNYDPDIVGISWFFSRQKYSTEETARIVKGIDNTIPVVMGGAHPSSVPYEVLSNPNVDFVIIGEGEDTFAKFIDCYGNIDKYKNIDGFGYKYKVDSEIKINPKTNYIEDLDTLPFPAWHLLPMKKYFDENKQHKDVYKTHPIGWVVTSRGCPGKCVFCSIHSVMGHKWRARSPESVIDEIEYLVDKYGVKEIHFEDDNLTLSRKRAEKIFDLIIDRDVDITWRAPNGIAVSTLTKPIIAKMERSGCYNIALGLESGNPYILKNVIKKRYSFEHAEEAIKWIKNANITTTGFFIIGVPGETKKTIYDTIKWAAKLDLDDAGFFSAQPYPGTELYELCKKDGYLRIKNLSQLKTSSASIETPLLSQKELKLLQPIAYAEFGLRKRIRHPYRTFKNCKNLNEIKTVIYILKSLVLNRLRLVLIRHGHSNCVLF